MTVRRAPTPSNVHYKTSSQPSHRNRTASVYKQLQVPSFGYCTHRTKMLSAPGHRAPTPPSGVATVWCDLLAIITYTSKLCYRFLLHQLGNCRFLPSSKYSSKQDDRPIKAVVCICYYSNRCSSSVQYLNRTTEEGRKHNWVSHCSSILGSIVSSIKIQNFAFLINATVQVTGCSSARAL